MNTSNAAELPIKTVLLDFHGLMTDHNKRLKLSIEYACRDCTTLPQGLCEFLHNTFSQRGDDESLEDFLQRQIQSFEAKSELNVSNEEFDFLLKRIGYYRDSLYIPVDGLVETLNQLNDMGINIMVVTNGSVKKHDFPGEVNYASYSDVIYDLLGQWGVNQSTLERMIVISALDDLQFFYLSEEFGKPAGRLDKPHPVLMDGIARIHAASGLGSFEPSRTLMVGDYQTDIAFASSLGGESLLRCAFYLKGKRQILNGIPTDHLGDYESRNDLLHAIYNVRELPYLCTNPYLLRELTYITEGESEDVVIRAEDGSYQLNIGLDRFNGVDFYAAKPPLIPVETEVQLDTAKVL